MKLQRSVAASKERKLSRKDGLGRESSSKEKGAAGLLQTEAATEELASSASLLGSTRAGLLTMRGDEE